MRDTLKATIYGALGLCAVAVIALVLRGTGLLSSKIFAPREEAVRRETFEQSKAYLDGGAQELRAMQTQYVTADSLHREALRDVILHRAAGYDESRLPSDVRAFLHSLQTRY